MTRRQSLVRFIPVSLLLLAIAVVLVGPFVVPGDPDEVNMGRRLAAPGSAALLGTDNLGRDTLLRLVHGGRAALLSGLFAVVASLAIATIVGTIAGFFGGWVDLLIAGILDILLALPGLLITLAILGILGIGPVSLVIALVGGSWAGEARIIRGAVLQLRTAQFVEAAQSLGASRRRILIIHVIPNVVTTIAILSSLALGESLLVLSSLSFLGLGAQPPAADWGTMLADSRPFLSQAPWLMLGPGLCIVGFSLLANLAGDSLRALFNSHGV